ncbi:flagellar basal body P-ring protein FlgI [Luminiphilus sp.]|nr:flagellar basal body P-ring protein FlgI [Luminiphilus sp.]MDB2379407.1 flagellar basal body P-ring protein FlgI [Luminiphilus sp.]MDB2667008.1 flagellar basal body P-ring protein FlgI [Luminiphilus sp.]MDB3934126.1 flagellar basal body P-ring protein FlgI [Luminiphilus sp.]
MTHLTRHILPSLSVLFSGVLAVTLFLVFSLALLAPSSAKAERIKDIAMVEGARSNQLVGFGLVVGLDGTGDQVTQTPFTIQAARSMLQQFGVNLPQGVNPQTKNMASVIVTAELPAFGKPGQKLDVTVSSLGNAGSLRGGELLLTSLKGGNGQVYAVAQGSLVVSGFGAEGGDGSRIQVNTKSAGRIPNGAIIEREVASSLTDGTDKVRFLLHEADFSTARNAAFAINSIFGPGTAKALDGVSVEVAAPTDPSAKVAYLAELENVEVARAAPAAKVIINSRSGTIVFGSQVTVGPAAVAHGNLTVTVDESLLVSQPGPFARGGQTAVVPDTDITIEEEEVRMFAFEGGVDLSEIVTAVNRVGAAPGDLVAILEALQKAGAISAQLIVI